jgi:hypothetical protein
MRTVQLLGWQEPASAYERLEAGEYRERLVAVLGRERSLR